MQHRHSNKMCLASNINTTMIYMIITFNLFIYKIFIGIRVVCVSVVLGALDSTLHYSKRLSHMEKGPTNHGEMSVSSYVFFCMVVASNGVNRFIPFFSLFSEKFSSLSSNLISFNHSLKSKFSMCTLWYPPNFPTFSCFTVIFAFWVYSFFFL